MCRTRWPRSGCGTTAIPGPTTVCAGCGDELYFRRHYLMIIVDEDPLYVDCTPGTSGTSTGLYLSHDLSRATRVDLLDRLRLWLDALNRGLWRIDTNGNWVVDASQAPVDRFWPWLYT